MPEKWSDDYDIVLSFCQALIDAEVLETPGETLEYFERPSKYNKHYALWHSLDDPTPGDEGWKEFYDATT